MGPIPSQGTKTPTCCPVQQIKKKKESSGVACAHRLKALSSGPNLFSDGAWEPLGKPPANPRNGGAEPGLYTCHPPVHVMLGVEEPALLPDALWREVGDGAE